MDYRYRKYFIVRLDEYYFNKQIEELQNAVPSLKIHAPYNHFKNNDIHTDVYDGVILKKMFIFC